MAKEHIDESNRRNQNEIRHKIFNFDSESLFSPNLKELGEFFS